MDETTAIAELKRLVQTFADERNWGEFHTPKNLATSVLIEAAELAEHFQWATPAESYAIVKNDASRKEAVAEELCDVFAYLLALANTLEIDIASSFKRKMEKNAKKHLPLRRIQP